MSENPHASRIDQLIESSQDVIAAARRPDGMDQAGWTPPAVTVLEGRDGGPEVRLDTAWERLVPATELGTAVTAAITTFLRAQQPEAEPVEALPAWHPDTSGENLTAAMERINAALGESYAKLAHSQKLLAGEAPTLATERGTVRARAQDGNVVAVDIDASWATGKSGATIGMEISGVMADGATTRTTPGDPLATDPLAVYDYLREMLSEKELR